MIIWFWIKYIPMRSSASRIPPSCDLRLATETQQEFVLPMAFLYRVAARVVTSRTLISPSAQGTTIFVPLKLIVTFMTGLSRVSHTGLSVSTGLPEVSFQTPLTTWGLGSRQGKFLSRLSSPVKQSASCNQGLNFSTFRIVRCLFYLVIFSI